MIILKFFGLIILVFFILGFIGAVFLLLGFRSMFKQAQRDMKNHQQNQANMDDHDPEAIETFACDMCGMFVNAKPTLKSGHCTVCGKEVDR